MGKIDFSKFPKAQELIIDAEIENEKDRIKWLPAFDKEDAALALAKMYVTAKASTSNDLNARKKASKATDKLFFEVSEKIHVFARAEARSRLGYVHSDITRLFCHIAFGGEKYRK